MVEHQFGKVGVLFGGRSSERKISLMSGMGVLQALKSYGIDAHPFDPAKRNLTDLVAEKFDRVFIALHGRYGEDGTLQGALEQLEIPYTGSGVMASAIGMNKIMTKRIWHSMTLPTPRFIILDAHSTTHEELCEVPNILNFPLMLKAPHEGSTIGISKVTDYYNIKEGFALCAKYDQMVLAEEFIAGRELTVPVLGIGHKVSPLPIVEIRTPGGKYDYQHKYFANDTQYLCPAPLDDTLTQHIQLLAVQAFSAIGCKGWARVDFILRLSDEKPFLLEINTSPGMTTHSLVPIAAKSSGISYEDLCVEILSLASLNLKALKDWEPNSC